jgi:hypothetical protein
LPKSLPLHPRLLFSQADLPGIKVRAAGPCKGYFESLKNQADGWLTREVKLPDRDGHGHPDKLNFVLSGLGEGIAPDPGTANYGVPIQAGWFRTTLADNTLVVDEKSQQPADGLGRETPCSSSPPSKRPSLRFGPTTAAASPSPSRRRPGCPR